MKNNMANSSGGSVFASVFISLIVVGAGIYFGLPYIYPNINNPEYVDDDKAYENVVVQVKSLELKSICFLWDDEMTEKMMNETTILVTTQGNTSLSIEFSTSFMYGVSTTFDTVSEYDFVSYNISMVISGVGNYSKNIEFGELSSGQWGTLPYQMHVVTPTLSAGVYNISMYWFSRVNATGDNYLSANHANNFRYNPRLFYIEEIKLV